MKRIVNFIGFVLLFTSLLVVLSCTSMSQSEPWPPLWLQETQPEMDYNLSPYTDLSIA